LVVKVLAQSNIWDLCDPLIVGDPDVMHQNARMLGSTLRFRPAEGAGEARFAPPQVDVICPTGARVGDIRWGVLSPAMGRAGMTCLAHAYDLALRGAVQGVVSAPLNKEAFHLAGYHHADELVFLAEHTHSPDAFILGVMDGIWTIAVTEHIPFRQIADGIKRERVLWCITQMQDVLRRMGVPGARIAVAALNVHGGEGGLYGREEIDEIRPAIEAAGSRGIVVQGPVPADTVFVRALAGEFAGVVCMYHDQANIARKLQPRNKGATIFMGLPVACGTTAHGTAFDRAARVRLTPAAWTPHCAMWCNSLRNREATERRCSAQTGAGGVHAALRRRPRAERR